MDYQLKDKFIPTLEIAPENLKTFVVDVTKEDGVKAWVDGSYNHFGHIDIVIPNAGYESAYMKIQDCTYGNYLKVYTDMICRIEKNTFGDTKTHKECEAVFAASYLDKRYCKSSEVADLALFLVSPVSSHTMGSGIRLDGGMNALC